MKNLKLILLTALLAVCQTNPAQEDVTSGAADSEQEELTLEQVCSENPCRENVRVRFRTERDPVDEIIPLYWPRVFNDVISVLPGESFFVEADLIDGKLVNLREVSENLNPAKTITIEFKQMDEGVGMMLSLNNPFEEAALKFNMDMIDFNGNPHQTSSCPAMPKGSIFESWPHPIPELVIKNPIVFSIEGMESMSCVY